MLEYMTYLYHSGFSKTGMALSEDMVGPNFMVINVHPHDPFKPTVLGYLLFSNTHMLCHLVKCNDDSQILLI